MKRILSAVGLVGFVIASALLIPATSQAFSAKNGSTVAVSKSDVTSGTLYAAGKTVTIDGDIRGDLFCAGSSVTVNGSVSGDLICAAQTIDINGAVGGNVRVAAQTVNLNSTVARNVTVFAQTLLVSNDAKINGDLTLFAQSASIYGATVGELYGAASSLTIGSSVGGDVNLALSSLSLSSSAAVARNLTYTSSKEVAFDKSKVAGVVTFKQADTAKAHAKQAHGFDFGAWLLGRLYIILAAYAVALVGLWLAPKPLRAVTSTMLEKPLVALGWGFLAMIVVPLVLLLALVTVIGIPLAVLIGTLWVVAIALSGLFASLAVGRWIARAAKWNDRSLVGAIGIGIPVGFVAMGLPILGFLLSFVAIWWTLGSLALNASALRD